MICKLKAVSAHNRSYVNENTCPSVSFKNESDKHNEVSIFIAGLGGFGLLAID